MQPNVSRISEVMRSAHCCDCSLGTALPNPHFSELRGSTAECYPNQESLIELRISFVKWDTAPQSAVDTGQQLNFPSGLKQGWQGEKANGLLSK